MYSWGSGRRAQSTEKASLKAQTVGGREYPPEDFENQLFGKGLMLKFYTPVSTSVLSEILLVKHLEQRLACK